MKEMYLFQMTYPKGPLQGEPRQFRVDIAPEDMSCFGMTLDEAKTVALAFKRLWNQEVTLSKIQIEGGKIVGIVPVP